MKKIFLALIITMFTSAAVFAETIIGTALTEFSTENPAKHFTVQINEGFTVNGWQKYPAGTVFSGTVVRVENGKIGKRKGYFVFVPTYYSDKNDVHKITTNNLEVKVEYYKPFDKDKALKNLANTGLSTAASKILHVPLLSQGIAFVKGAVNPDEDTNRLVSGVKSAYKSTPLTYVEKGDELHVQPGQEVKLIISQETAE
ncbi:MAG: hypothetical protein K6C94_04545 [Candidatus Gastranaerophilales bacterium]|nr:hypothetical protein [Candidatus Gastranaerophilales bacterium]